MCDEHKFSGVLPLKFNSASIDHLTRLVNLLILCLCCAVMAAEDQRWHLWQDREAMLAEDIRTRKNYGFEGHNKRWRLTKFDHEDQQRRERENAEQRQREAAARQNLAQLQQSIWDAECADEDRLAAVEDDDERKALANLMMEKRPYRRRELVGQAVAAATEWEASLVPIGSLSRFGIAPLYADEKSKKNGTAAAARGVDIADGEVDEDGRIRPAAFKVDKGVNRFSQYGALSSAKAGKQWQGGWLSVQGKWNSSTNLLDRVRLAAARAKQQAAEQRKARERKQANRKLQKRRRSSTGLAFSLRVKTAKRQRRVIVTPDMFAMANTRLLGVGTTWEDKEAERELSIRTRRWLEHQILQEDIERLLNEEREQWSLRQQLVNRRREVTEQRLRRGLTEWYACGLYLNPHEAYSCVYIAATIRKEYPAKG